jgi:hypothetical protein
MAPKTSGNFRTKTITTTQQQTRTDNGIITLRYEETLPAKPPIAVTVAPPRAPPTDTHPALRRPSTGAEEKDESKRDSGLAPATSSKARDDSVNTVDDNALGVAINFNSSPQAAKTPYTPRQVPRTPKFTKSDSMGSGSVSRWRKPGSTKGSLPRTPPSAAKTEEEFSPITTPIPTDSLLDEDFLEQLSFSTRGSMMLGGKKAVSGHSRANGGRRWVSEHRDVRYSINKHFRQPSFSMLASPSIRVLSDDLEKESQKVRSMYETGSKDDWQDGRYSATASQPHIEGEDEPPT